MQLCIMSTTRNGEKKNVLGSAFNEVNSGLTIELDNIYLWM